MICIGILVHFWHSQPPKWWSTSVSCSTFHTHNHRHDDLHQYFAPLLTLATTKVMIYIGILLYFAHSQLSKWWFTSLSCSTLKINNYRNDDLHRYFDQHWRLRTTDMMIYIGIFLHSGDSEVQKWWYTSVSCSIFETQNHRNVTLHRYLAPFWRLITT